MKIKRFLAATLALGVLAVMSGCNTVNDVKDDVKEGADRVEEGVDNITDNDTNDNVKIDVTLTVEAKDIIGSEYAGNFNEEMLADEGVILSQTKYTVEEGTTVQELVRKALDESQIEYEMNDVDNSMFIQGIRGITRGMAGEPSGWVYSINGERTKDEMNTYKLKDGDDVKVYYKLDMNADITDNNNIDKTNEIGNTTGGDQTDKVD